MASYCVVIENDRGEYFANNGKSFWFQHEIKGFVAVFPTMKLGDEFLKACLRKYPQLAKEKPSVQMKGID